MASLITCSDVYVSLHRSEGFGLGIAEAMLAGRPAIATAYSGNMDFMISRTAVWLATGFARRPLRDLQQPRYGIRVRARATLGEPNIDQAARWMRLSTRTPGSGSELGSAGSATISTHYSSAAAGAAAVARLAQIASDLARSQSHPCQAP